MYRPELESYLADLSQIGSIYGFPDVSIYDLTENEKRIIEKFEKFAIRLVIEYQKQIRELS